ncbi:MAG TPA: universal stress protein [Acidimicrobiales bacterium]
MTDPTPGDARPAATTSGPAADPDPGDAPYRAETVAVAHVVVPLDGSPFAERALPVADWMAGGLGADVHLVEVVRASDEEDGAMRYLDTVARRQQAAAWEVVESRDVAAALADHVTAAPGRLACVATHGRDRSATLLGSVAASLLDRIPGPVMLVGPDARAVTAADAPVVVAVDGTRRDHALVPVALGWAVSLGRRLEIVTIAEPAPAYRDDRPPTRARGPARPEAYVAALAARAEGAGVAVASQVAYDPVGVRDGLVPLLDRTAALVVLGSRRRGGLPRAVLGSHAIRIVHEARVPALVVPWADQP